ncbi:MAG: DUF1501 domain-containing protein, partial [Gemmatimonadales bacterium]
LGRHIAGVPPMMMPGGGTPLLRAVGMNSGLAKALAGAPGALPILNLDNFGLAGASSTLGARQGAINGMYVGSAEPLRSIALNTLATIDLLNTINFATYAPAGGAVYPPGSLGYSLKTSAALIKAQTGVEAITIDFGGWDTHSAQGSVVGTMGSLMTTLSQGLGALYTDLFTGTNPSVCVVVMSEFGRRLAENGSLGCDHGHGNLMMVLGNAVAGGRVMSNWPGLAPNQLFQGLDVQVTIDYRDVLSEILRERLGNANMASVFPGYTPVDRGVLA